MDIAPAIHALPKSTYSEVDKARVIRNAMRVAIGIDTWIPVVYGGKVVGATCGTRNSFDVKFAPLTHRQWCGFNNYSELQLAVTSGRIITTVCMKTWTRNGNGDWNDLWPVSNASSIPPAGDYSGTAHTARQINDTTVGTIQNHFTPGGSKTAHVFSYRYSSNQNSLTTFCLYDRVLSYDNEVISTSTTTMTNTLPAQRYIGTGDPGLLLLTTNTGGTVIGATPSNLSAMNYTDQSGNAQAVPLDTTIEWYPGTSATFADTGATLILPRSAGFTVSPFMALVPGGTGMRSITDYTSTANNTGQACMALIRPLGWITTGPVSNNSYVYLPGRDVMAMDRIYDGAGLSFLANSVSNITHRIDTSFVWG